MATAPLSFHFMLILCLLTTILTSSREENQFFYNDFKEAKLQRDGIAKIHPNGLLQLTDTSKLQKGHAFYPYPINFKNSSLSFSTTFVFAIVPEFANFSGHGLALTISPSMDFSKANPTQFLGLFNPSNNGDLTNGIFAVEVDTVQTVEFKDINNNHVGIDLNNLTSVDSIPVTYFSDKDGENKTLKLTSGDPIQMWIDYEGNEKLLNLTVAPMGIPKPSKSLLSTPIDLSSVFLDSMDVGFSSATGEMASNHYILGWSFNKSGQARNLEISKLPEVPFIPKFWIQSPPSSNLLSLGQQLLQKQVRPKQ